MGEECHYSVKKQLQIRDHYAVQHIVATNDAELKVDFLATTWKFTKILYEVVTNVMCYNCLLVIVSI